MDLTRTAGEIPEVAFVGAGEVGEQCRSQGTGHRNDPARVAPAIASGDDSAAEIEVSDARAHELGYA